MTSGEERGPVWRFMQAGAALLALGLFLAALWPHLGPFLLFLFLVGALLPFRDRAGHGLLITLCSLLLLFWVLNTTGFLLAPFVLALGLAYVADPLVDRLERRRIGRSVGIVLLALPVAAVLVVGVVFGLPALGGQLSDLISQTPRLLQRVADWVEALDTRLSTLSVPPVVREVVDRIRGVQADSVVEFLQQRREEIAARIWDGVLGLSRGLGSALTILGYVVLTPVLTFYLLRDWDHLTRGLAGLLPAGRRDEVVGFFREYDRLLSRYLRGQVTVALVIGGITALGLWIARFPFALLLGVLVAVFGFVPYVGLVLSLIPAVLIALLGGNVLMGLLKVAVVYGVAQTLEGAVVSPRIVGESVGLHPVWVVLALAMGGYFFGFVGLLLGVPMAVGVKLLAVRGLERYRESRLFREGGTEAAEG